MRRSLFLSPIIFVLACAAGGSHHDDDDDSTLPEGCSDIDGDGYGVGADCTGPDCDEHSPLMWDLCGEDCDEVPNRTGCPCDDQAEPDVCYEGPEGALGNGSVCRPGLRRCVDGVFSGCEGQVFPQPEQCDEDDDDCDGEIDNGVRNSCGTCNADCDEIIVGNEKDDWDLESEGGRGLVLDENGELTLDEDSTFGSYIWIPNAGDGTVIKVNTRTFVQEGRYATGPGAFTWIGGISANPNFDVVVTGNSGSPRVTRVNATECADGDTSTGPDDILPFGDDACVAWSTEIAAGGFGFGVTNLAWELRDQLDGLEFFIWVVDNAGLRVFEMSEDGEETGRDVSVAPVYPGAVAMDRDGDLWVADSASASAVLTEIDTVDAEIIRTIPMPGWTCLCMACDAENNVWVTGSGGPGYVLDQEEEEVFNIGVPTAVGLAVNYEDYAWFGGSDGRVHRVDHSGGLDDMQVESFDVGLGAAGGFGGGMIYVAIDIDEQPWGMEATSGTTANVWSSDDPEEWDIAVDGLQRPGACGDMTGTQLGHMVEPSGIYRHVFEGCEGADEFDGPGTEWISLRYEATTAADSTIEFAVKTAATLAELVSAEVVPVGIAPTDESPLDVAGALERAGVDPLYFLELQVTLKAGSDGERPVLQEIGMSRSCGGVID